MAILVLAGVLWSVVLCFVRSVGVVCGGRWWGCVWCGWWRRCTVDVVIICGNWGCSAMFEMMRSVEWEFDWRWGEGKEVMKMWSVADDRNKRVFERYSCCNVVWELFCWVPLRMVWKERRKANWNLKICFLPFNFKSKKEYLVFFSVETERGKMVFFGMRGAEE